MTRRVEIDEAVTVYVGGLRALDAHQFRHAAKGDTGTLGTVDEPAGSLVLEQERALPDVRESVVGQIHVEIAIVVVVESQDRLAVASNVEVAKLLVKLESTLLVPEQESSGAGSRPVLVAVADQIEIAVTVEVGQAVVACLPVVREHALEPQLRRGDRTELAVDVLQAEDLEVTVSVDIGHDRREAIRSNGDRFAGEVDRSRSALEGNQSCGWSARTRLGLFQRQQLFERQEIDSPR